MLKGGHLEEGDEVFDRYADATSRDVFVHRRLLLQAHGTGCSFAAAVAATGTYRVRYRGDAGPAVRIG